MKKLAYLCGIACLLLGCQQTQKIEATSSLQQETGYIEFEQHYYMKLSDGSIKKIAEQVKMAKEPKRVVVLDIPTLDSLYAVNIYQQIVGLRADKAMLHHLPDKLRREFSKKQYVSVGNKNEVDFNIIKKLSPEVIFIGENEATESTINQLKQTAPNAKIIYSGIDYQHYLTSLKQQSKLLGNIFNKASLYETYLTNIELDINYIQQFDKKDLKLAIVDVQGYEVALTTNYNNWLAQLGLSEHSYQSVSPEENQIEMQSEEVVNQRTMIARESATEDDSVVVNREHEIDKNKQVTIQFDKNIAIYQPTAILFIDDVLDENNSNMKTILSANYTQNLSAINANHYRVGYATEWKTVYGGIYSCYLQVEDIVKLLQKTNK